MPKSKNRKSRSKRPAQPAPQPTKRKPSPKWVPSLGIGLIAVGTVVVIIAYVSALSSSLVLLGFALMGAGLVTLSQLR